LLQEGSNRGWGSLDVAVQNLRQNKKRTMRKTILDKEGTRSQKEKALKEPHGREESCREPTAFSEGAPVQR